MHNLVPLIFGIWLFLAAAPGASQEVLEYQFSFGEEIVLGPGINRVRLTVTNSADTEVDCGVASLLDGTSPDPLLSRVRFQPVEGSTNCIGGGCTAIISPPPRIALWSSVGPFAPGESKSCEFDVQVAIPFVDEITLVGSAGPVRVVLPVHAVPSLGLFGLLLLALGLAASIHFLRVRVNA